MKMRVNILKNNRISLFIRVLFSHLLQLWRSKPPMYPLNIGLRLYLFSNVSHVSRSIAWRLCVERIRGAVLCKIRWVIPKKLGIPSMRIPSSFSISRCFSRTRFSSLKCSTKPNEHTISKWGSPERSSVRILLL